MALYTDGSPECSRATSKPASVAATSSAVIASRSRSAVSTSRAPDGAVSSSSRGTSAPAYRQTGADAISRAARTVIRSAAPGPAPMKWTVMTPPPRFRARNRAYLIARNPSSPGHRPDRHGHRGPPAGEAADRFGLGHRDPGERAAPPDVPVGEHGLAL